MGRRDKDDYSGATPSTILAYVLDRYHEESRRCDRLTPDDPDRLYVSGKARAYASVIRLITGKDPEQAR